MRPFVCRIRSASQIHLTVRVATMSWRSGSATTTTRTRRSTNRSATCASTESFPKKRNIAQKICGQPKKKNKITMGILWRRRNLFLSRQRAPSCHHIRTLPRLRHPCHRPSTGPGFRQGDCSTRECMCSPHAHARVQIWRCVAQIDLLVYAFLAAVGWALVVGWILGVPTCDPNLASPEKKTRRPIRICPPIPGGPLAGTPI